MPAGGRRGRRGRRPGGRSRGCACRTRAATPGAAAAAPNAAWAIVAPRLRRLRLHLDHLGHQRERVGVQAVDRLAVRAARCRAGSTRRGAARRPGRRRRCRSAQPRLAELPPDTTAASTRRPPRPRSASASSSSMFALVGDDAALAGEVGADARPASRPRQLGDPLRERRRASAGGTPSRRSPSSTISTTPCVRPWRTAAATRAVEHRQLGVEADVGVRAPPRRPG